MSEVTLCPESSARVIRNCPIFKWELPWWNLQKLAQFTNIHVLPLLYYFMHKQNFTSFVVRLYSTINAMGCCCSIRKFPFPNESYHNGVCKALWTLLLKAIVLKKDEVSWKNQRIRGTIVAWAPKVWGKKQDTFKNYPLYKIHIFWSILMKLDENNYLMRWSFSPNMKIAQKLWIFY